MASEHDQERIDRALAEHHLAHLTTLQKAELRLRSRGARPDEIGAVVHRAASSVRRDLDDLQDLMLRMVGVPHDGWLAGRWCTIHDDCCLG